MVGGWLIGFALVALVTLLVAGWLTWPAPVRPAAGSQPVVGRAITVTGLVFDGVNSLTKKWGTGGHGHGDKH
jgi:hypothetical protein